MIGTGVAHLVSVNEATWRCERRLWMRFFLWVIRSQLQIEKVEASWVNSVACPGRLIVCFRCQNSSSSARFGRQLPLSSDSAYCKRSELPDDRGGTGRKGLLYRSDSHLRSFLFDPPHGFLMGFRGRCHFSWREWLFSYSLPFSATPFPLTIILMLVVGGGRGVLIDFGPLAGNRNHTLSWHDILVCTYCLHTCQAGVGWAP